MASESGDRVRGELAPRVAGTQGEGDWRKSPLSDTTPSLPDLSALVDKTRGRNVIHVILESTAERYLKLYGAAEDTMPRLGELAREGITFENAYTTYPESIKWLFAVLCSSYPAFDTNAELYAKVPCVSIAQALKEAGYATGLFHSGRFGYLGMEAVVKNRGFDTLEDAGDLGAGKQSSFGLEDERDAVRHVVKWIDALPKGKRFYIAYLPIAGHHPYANPEGKPFPEDGGIGSYRNSLRHADTALGILVDALKERKLDRETLFVIHGDHGQAFGQHDGNFAHSLYVFEENVKVPLVIAAPGALAQKRVGGAASLVDLAPTVLDAVGVPAPGIYQGESLWRRVPSLALFFADYSTGWIGLRDGNWKAMLEVESRRIHLYDLSNEPAEKADLAGEHPDAAAAYAKHLMRWSEAQRYRVLRAAEASR